MLIETCISKFTRRRLFHPPDRQAGWCRRLVPTHWPTQTLSIGFKHRNEASICVQQTNSIMFFVRILKQCRILSCGGTLKYTPSPPKRPTWQTDSYTMGFWGYFSIGDRTVACAWSQPLTSIYCRYSKWVDINLLYATCIYGVHRDLSF
jgi:hypothetical protein